MKFKSPVFIAFFVIFFQQSFAQHNYDEYNRLGITGGVTIFDVSTSNFTTKKGNGMMFGFTTRGSFYNNFDLIYGIGFTNNNLVLIGKEAGNSSNRHEIKYTIQSAQINFLASYNIIKHQLSLEFGPILNLNGKMKLKTDRYEAFILEGTQGVLANEVEDISKVNFLVMGGLTAGLENFRLIAQYQYGVTNMFNKLNEKDFGEEIDFNGNSSTLILGAVIYF
jgi:hypothetical protein